MRLVAHQQAILDDDPVIGQRLDLLEQRRRIHDHTVADNATDLGVQDAGRDEVQDKLLPVDVHRVACVVTTLVSSHDRERRREQVDDLAFALVAPLRAQHRQIHVARLPYPRTPARP